MSDPPETHGSLELAARLRLTIARTARRLRQEADAGLSPSLGSALATIERLGPLTPSQLADCERVSRPTATRLIARLEAAGFAERSADPEDGRSRLIGVTRAGAGRLQRSRKRKNAYLARRLVKLEPEELRTLAAAAAILERMLEDGRA